MIMALSRPVWGGGQSRFAIIDILTVISAEIKQKTYKACNAKKNTISYFKSKGVGVLGG